SWSVSSTVRGACSILTLMGAPVLLQVADQRGAEVAERLLAGVGRHVFAKGIQRFLTNAEGPPVRDAADRARARQVGGGALDRPVHLAGRDDVVGELLGCQLAVGEDRLAGAAVADEAREPQVRRAGDDPLVAGGKRAAAAGLGEDVVDAQQQLARAADRVRL